LCTNDRRGERNRVEITGGEEVLCEECRRSNSRAVSKLFQKPCLFLPEFQLASSNSKWRFLKLISLMSASQMALQNSRYRFWLASTQYLGEPARQCRYNSLNSIGFLAGAY
jgi:hypothetical protein